MDSVFKGLDRSGSPKKLFLKKPQSVSLKELEGWPKEKWKSVLIEQKFDGLRAIYFRGSLYSFNGLRLSNVRIIERELQRVAGTEVIFDGELCGKNWEEVMSVARSPKTEKDIGNLKYYIFDVMNQNDFIQGSVSNNSLIQRRYLLSYFLPGKFFGFTCPWKFGSFVPFEKVLTRTIENGGEGLMIKDIHMPYDFWRNKSWLRIKIDKTEDVKVIGFEEGKGKYKGMLGSLECIEDDGKKCNVSGFTDHQRVSIWRNKKYWLGKLIEVKYLKRTEQGNLFSPRFKRVRWDKK